MLIISIILTNYYRKFKNAFQEEKGTVLNVLRPVETGVFAERRPDEAGNGNFLKREDEIKKLGVSAKKQYDGIGLITAFLSVIWRLLYKK